MDFIELLADLLRSHVFLDGLHFSGSAIFVSAADINGVVAPQPTVASIDVGAEYATNDISKVRDVVYVWECRSYKNTFPFRRQNFLRFSESLNFNI